MIEPLTSLAFALHSNRGVYALLLGSGLSRSAGIPTGWDITLDLTRGVARLQGADCEPDPAAWYRAAFGREPDYADLLDQIARTPTDRNQLLKRYLEPSKEDRERGAKTPTAAHHAVARLAAAGIIRVILTTNFDRLTEQALEAAGVVPAVISTPDAIEGALPLVHAPCTLIKLHGDYLDTRIKNTPGELGAYDDRLNRLLDRVFDEYGLITCGWSADWDVALVAALERCPCRRFTTYWTVKGPLGENARRLIAHRQAVVIAIEDADSFFAGVAEKVASLEELAQPHPLSPAIAAATLKRYLGAGQKIKVYDLATQEADALRDRTVEPRFSPDAAFSPADLARRLEQYEAAAQTMMQIMVQGCFWGEQEQEELWVRCLERVHGPARYNGDRLWTRLHTFPALLLFYAGGIAAGAAGKVATLAALLTRGSVPGLNRPHRLTTYLYPTCVLDKERVMAHLPPYDNNRHTPGSDYLFDHLRTPLLTLFSTESDYSEAFNRFEYLMALSYAHMRVRDQEALWGPVGRFAWDRYSYPENGIQARVEAEARAMGEAWPMLRAGLFEGSPQRFLEIKREYDLHIQRMGWT